MDSLSHTDETQSRREPGALNIEADAVIVYFQPELVVRTSQLDPDALRTAVLRCIMHSFLQHPKKGQCDHAVQFLLKKIAGTMNWDT